MGAEQGVKDTAMRFETEGSGEAGDGGVRAPAPADAPERADPHLTGEYLRRNPGWHVHTSEWKAGEILKMLDRHGLAPRSIGEVGCGAGEVLRQLQLRMDPDCRFFGWDIAPDAIRLAKARENDRLQVALADATAIETPPLDLMLVLEVVDHVEDYFSFLRRLKPRSTYQLFHFSLDLSVQNALRGGALLRQREQYVHLHYFNKDTALRTLEETGYEILDWFYTPYGVLFPGGRFNRWVVGPVRRVLYRLNRDLAVRILGGYRLMVLTR
jgi:SAM-dependent methyltransferase